MPYMTEYAVPEEVEVRPYTMQEGVLDLARAVRLVRSHSQEYGFDGENIAIIGFSAGGILCGEEILNFDGFIDGTKIDSSYISDELDTISADVKAVGFIYSFYGRLANTSTDVEFHKYPNLGHGFGLGIGRSAEGWINDAIKF